MNRPAEPTDHAQAALLAASGVSVSYDGRPVVADVSLALRDGEALALLGPNGAGKSTLMRVLAGLEPPDAGRVEYRGRPVGPDDAGYRRAAVAVLQRPYLWRGTVADNVEYGLRVRGLAKSVRRRRAGAWLEALGIGDLADAAVDTLSGGESQRVALARALVLEPEILFLDEPTADLDVTVRTRLLGDLERIVDRASCAVVLITHDPGEAFALADRIAVMEAGRIVQTGRPQEIFEAPATEFVASFTGAEFLLQGRVEGSAAGTVHVRLDSGLTIDAAGDAPADRPVKVGYRPEDVVIAPTHASATSARNRFAATVSAIHPRGGLVRLRLHAEGQELAAVITRNALEELGLEVGSRVTAQIKATALHVFTV